ncbi:hypothetical protein BV901_10255 [Serratia nematodiphila]|nr:hypothetical protein BV901_10255 [Serratia nematodiphila]
MQGLIIIIPLIFGTMMMKLGTHVLAILGALYVLVIDIIQMEQVAGLQLNGVPKEFHVCQKVPLLASSEFVCEIIPQISLALEASQVLR